MCKNIVLFLIFVNILYKRNAVASENISPNKNLKIDANFTELKETNVCGKIYSGKETIVTSPNYPNSYPKNFLCTYIFRNENGNKCDFNFKFLDFKLETSYECNKDKLKILDNDVLCGNQIGVNTYSTETNELNVQFVSDDNIEQKGFKIMVTQLGCKEVNPVTSTQETVLVEAESNNKEIFENQINNSVSFLFSNKTDVEIIPATEVTTEVQPKNEPQFDYVPPTGTNNFPNIPFYPNNIPNFPSSPGSPIPPFLPNFPTSPGVPVVPSYPGPNVPINPYLPIFPGSGGFPTSPPLPIPLCCANSFFEKRFLISSPGFPSTSQGRIDCQYRIFRSLNACKLRFNFRYFWTGNNDQQSTCPQGFVEIDGRRFCGCRSGLVYDVFWGNLPITVRYNNVGVPNSFISGFVIEVTQIDCPFRYIDNNANTKNASSSDKLKMLEFEDVDNRIKWPQKRSIDGNAYSNYNHSEQYNIGNTHSNRSKDLRMAQLSQRSTESTINYYFFEMPNMNKDAEEIDIFEPENVTARIFLPNGLNDNICRLWGFKQWLELSAEVLWLNRPQCIPPNANQLCHPLDQITGEFQSPNFPRPYPPNQNICYR